PGVVIEGKEVRETAVRGVLSRGMLLSEKELDMSPESAGLWELAAGTQPGTRLESIHPNVRDVLLEVDNKSLTHRPDLWGHHGVAREFSAIYGAPLRKLEVDERLAALPGKPAIRVSLSGEGVKGPDGLCRRYCGLQIDGIRVGPSPEWLRHRLHAVGARPINNIVDITNLILFELGQPLHAFDTRRVEGGEIVVRRARIGEPIRLLDGSVLGLLEEDLVIADGREAVALAGIMGGATSQITDLTDSIFLESANFAPTRIRRTSVRVGKRTDSSVRFEKSLDPENARTGILRAARMVLDACPGARVVGPLQDVGFERRPPIEILTSAGFITGRLGVEVEEQKVRGALERLGFVLGEAPGDGWKVRVPSWRGTKDISIREDLVEEVGRILGYGSIRPFAPVWTVGAPRVNEHRRFERISKELLTLHGGLTEVYTYSMVGAGHCRTFDLDPDAHLKLKNPISEDMDRLRREIVPLLVEKAQGNQRTSLRFGFFEIGRVYRKAKEDLLKPELPEERTRAAAILSFEKKSEENFHEARHIVLSLLERLHVPEVEVVEGRDALPEPWAHPAVFALVLSDGKERGRIYRIHPAVEARLELKGEVLAFDLDLDALFEGGREPVHYRPPSRFPTVPFDVAVVADRRTTVREIRDVIQAASSGLLLSVEVFDVFEDVKLGAGKKSIAFHLVFGA
ncbi:MAG TPA: phenylalanine--tRNA ligase subunit beta, partial [Planctomycetota bacterium]|nr:phenylalanine--tRNA ligase subunit beta [Planctomycetota bacterium]